jgi:hypothetical protein
MQIGGKSVKQRSLGSIGEGAQAATLRAATTAKHL